MDEERETHSFENPAVPADLAEWLGAVRLTHLAFEAVQATGAPLIGFRSEAGPDEYSFRMLLTLLSYSYARGIYGSDEIQDRVRTDADLRYLCAFEFPNAMTLRQFRRREWTRLQATLAGLLRLATGAGEQEGWFNADAEAAARLERAAAADSLALDY